MQAKKKRPSKSRTPKPTSTGSIFSLSAFWIFFSGIVIGVLATFLWQGTMAPTTDIGVGIRSMIQESRDSAKRNQQVNENIEASGEAQLQTNYDFFTVLPEVEVVVADNTEETKPAAKSEKKEPEKKPESADSGSAYMLQAGSYKSEADARNLKVNLALSGLRAEIQKVTIQGRGDFYRVRLGPFSNYADMESTNNKLSQQGINAMRLKVSN